jgi:hypothetical protein
LGQITGSCDCLRYGKFEPSKPTRHQTEQVSCHGTNLLGDNDRTDLNQMIKKNERKQYSIGIQSELKKIVCLHSANIAMR